MAVGESLVFSTHIGNLVEHPFAESWNGTTWQRWDTPVPGWDAMLAGVSCTSVGAHAETSPTLISGTLVQRWDGAHWRTQQSPNPPGAGGAGLGAVSCPGPSACMAVGDFTGIGNELTLAEFWNGTAWAVVKTPHP
jgi:hypothetical protein